MRYSRPQMVYKDYTWSSKDTNDDPKFIHAQDSAMLNRREGYEMLYFINSLAKTWYWSSPVPVERYQNLEKVIREKVPGNIRTHAAIKDWIEKNYSI